MFRHPPRFALLLQVVAMLAVTLPHALGSPGNGAIQPDLQRAAAACVLLDAPFVEPGDAEGAGDDQQVSVAIPSEWPAPLLVVVASGMSVRLPPGIEAKRLDSRPRGPPSG